MVLGLVLGWFVLHMRGVQLQRQAVKAIEKAGGVVYYDYHWQQEWESIKADEPSTPAWLRRLVGDDVLANVAGIGYFRSETVDDAVLQKAKGLTTLKFLDLYDTSVTDEGLKNLAALTELELVDLSCTQTTDAGLENLKGLTQLKWLGLHATEVTDAGLKHLEGLTSLRRLGLSDTQVTDAGMTNIMGLKSLKHLDLDGTIVTEGEITRLRSSLPHCSITCTPKRR